MIAATYVLQVHTHHKAGPGDGRLREEFLRETEENITDLLPDGWWAEISEWNEPVILDQQGLDNPWRRIGRGDDR